MDWQSALKGFKVYLRLERSLSSNTIEAYIHDVGKLQQYLSANDLDRTALQITAEDLKNFIFWVVQLGMLPATQARVYQD